MWLRALLMGLVFGGLVLLAAGCLAPGTFHTARPIKTGKYGLGVAAHGWGLISGANGTGDPGFEVQFRYGVARWFDFGFKAFPLGLQADFNFSLVDTRGLPSPWTRPLPFTTTARCAPAATGTSTARSTCRS